MHSVFDQIISLENLCQAWKEFRKGKRDKADVQIFEYNLEDNLFKLYWELKGGRYQHRSYQIFHINDPKPRIIHKARVEDRIVHHAVFLVLYPLFDKSFIYDSYSCRVDKGTHRAVKRLQIFSRRASRTYQAPCYVLKGDISKFFASINHGILKSLLSAKVKCPRTLELLEEIVDSYGQSGLFSKGVPLGNLTSQLFANIYLDFFDQFIKHQLRVKYYIRYTDDFVVVDTDRDYLESLIPRIQCFLNQQLKLSLHPKKIVIRKLNQGIDFLGYVVLPHHQLLRAKTKNRMLQKMKAKCREHTNSRLSKRSLDQSLQSYMGLLKHCNGHGVNKELLHILGQQLS